MMPVATAVAATTVALTSTTTGVASATPATPSAVTVDVQTYNVDLGADLTPLFGATSFPTLVSAAADVYGTMQASMPAERMSAIARIIAKQRPELVGLQEVAEWATAPYHLTQLGPVLDGPYTVTYDFLAELQSALADAGVPYDVASTDVNFNSETAIPIPIPINGTTAARYVDRNVVLVSQAAKRHATLTNPQHGNFAARFPVSLLGQTIYVDRGWASVDLSDRGRTFRFFDTHLEAYGVPGTLKDQIRNPQAQELAGMVEESPYPTVVVGDINARPSMCQTWRQPPAFDDANVVAYSTLEGVGLTESWPLVHPDAPCDPASWTSGSRELDGPDSALTHRIDDVFVSDEFSALQSFVVGNTQAERSVPDNLWPSDHASTVAKIRLNAAPR